MTLNLTIPQQLHTDFTPRITVIGVGGGGTNAVNTMISLDLKGVDFVVANTDAQSLQNARADRRIQLGPHLTQGLGAGAKPEIGRAAAEEAMDEVYRHLDGAHMVFITAGMGGGTGTGAAPVIARMARERGILTVGVVTKPFTFEGLRRARAAEAGIEELQQWVDTLIVIPNQNLFRLSNERTGFKEAFKMADNVLYMGVRGVTDLMVAPGMVNLDFADIRTVMAEMGKAMMGTGEADGEGRALRAAELAISNPLLEDTSMSGARGLLINITGGEDLTLFEVDQAANRIREEVDEEANIIFGSAIDESLNGRIRVSVVATGIDNIMNRQHERPHLIAVGGGGMQSMAQAVGQQHAPAQIGAQAPAAQASHAQQIGFQATPQAGAMPAPRGLMPSVGRDPSLRSPLSRPMPQPASPGALRPALNAQPRQEARPAETRPVDDRTLDAMPQSFEIDDAPLPPRQIPAHLQQPLRPQASPLQRPASRQPEAKPAPRAGLFASEAPIPAPAPRKSLFGIVTGAIRGHVAELSAAHQEPRPDVQPAAQTRETPQPQVRPAASDEIGIEIPAFLRRQS
jgi:cell division protein FtsZ